MDHSPEKPLDEDAELMRKAAEGDIKAFGLLNKKYTPMLKQFFIKRGADKDSADDLVQKIFTSLWRRNKKFPGDSHFESYLYSMARNTLYQEIRRSHRITGLSSKKKPVSDEDTYKNFSQPEVELYLQELTDAVEAAKAKLTDQQIQALEVAQEADINLDKKLEKLGCSKEAYKKRLKRGRKRLMELLVQFFTDKKG